MVIVVDDVDAADERQAVVEQRHLAVQPTQQPPLDRHQRVRRNTMTFGALAVELRNQ